MKFYEIRFYRLKAEKKSHEVLTLLIINFIKIVYFNNNNILK